MRSMIKMDRLDLQRLRLTDTGGMEFVSTRNDCVAIVGLARNELSALRDLLIAELGLPGVDPRDDDGAEWVRMNAESDCVAAFVDAVNACRIAANNAPYGMISHAPTREAR